MPRAFAIANCAGSTKGRSLSLTSGALAAVATATFATGILSLILHLRTASPGRILAPAGILLLLCAAVQSRAAWNLWRGRTNKAPGAAKTTKVGAHWVFARRMILGAFAAYLLALVIGPVPHVEFAFVAGVAAWLTMLLLPLVWQGSWPRMPQWLNPRGQRRLGVALTAVLVVIVAEGAMQTYQQVRQLLRPGRDEADVRSAAAPTKTLDEHVAERGIANLAAGPFRVAVLTDESTDKSQQPHEYLVRLERDLPGVKFVRVPWNGKSQDVLARLTAERAHLVLSVLPVCRELTRAVPERSWFDWRQLALAQLVASPVEPIDAPAAERAADFESYCRGLVPQLVACRTPIDDTMDARWRESFASLDELAAECRAAGLPMVLVLMPGEFQVNTALRHTLARRAGYQAEQLDVDLPQRKLAGYADSRRLPLIDLLPSLRLCGESPYERHTTTFNETGHAAAANAIGGWLESRYGRQLSVAARLTSAQ